MYGCMPLRLRFPELLEERGMTPYALSIESGGRVSMTAIYRIVRQRGELQSFDVDLLEATCDVLDIDPGDLFGGWFPVVLEGEPPVVSLHVDPGGPSGAEDLDNSTFQDVKRGVGPGLDCHHVPI